MVVIEIQPDVEALFAKLGLCLTIAGATPVPASDDHDDHHEASTPATVKDGARQSPLKISLCRLDVSQQVKAEEAEVTHDCDSKTTVDDVENDDSLPKCGSELDVHDDKHDGDTATEPSVLTPASEEAEETSKKIDEEEPATPKKATTSTAATVDDIDNDHDHKQEDDIATNTCVLTPASDGDKETSKDVEIEELPTPKKETASTVPTVDDIDNDNDIGNDHDHDHEHEHDQTLGQDSFPSPPSTRPSSPQNLKELKEIALKRFTPRCPYCNAKAIFRVCSDSNEKNPNREYWVCSKEINWRCGLQLFLYFEDEVGWKKKMGLDGVDWYDLYEMGVAD
ncbi:hypothetical protein KEM55_002101 [Ascosphaera atra]|nr:hypothetical protein KEM55_002101 [Ascosphaera atra]